MFVYFWLLIVAGEILNADFVVFIKKEYDHASPSDSGVVVGQAGGGGATPSDNFFRGAKIRDCQCEISYKYVKPGLSTSSKIVVFWHFYCCYSIVE